MKIQIKEEVFDVPFEVRNHRLYNRNTRKFEGADGDIVTVKQYGEAIRGHVKGYTEHQIIPTYEWPTIIVSAQGLHDGTCSIEFIHQTPVFEAQKGRRGMTDKVQKIKDWISKEQDGLMDAQGNFENPCDEGAFHILTNLDYYIDSLQEVPCNHCQGFNDKEKCDELVFGHNCPVVKPISEDLEEAAKNHAAERYRATRDRELAEKCKWSFISGAKWNKKHN